MPEVIYEVAIPDDARTLHRVVRYLLVNAIEFLPDSMQEDIFDLLDGRDPEHYED